MLIKICTIFGVKPDEIIVGGDEVFHWWLFHKMDEEFFQNKTGPATVAWLILISSETSIVATVLLQLLLQRLLQRL